MTLYDQLTSLMLMSHRPGDIWLNKTNEWLHRYFPELLISKHVINKKNNNIFSHLIDVVNQVPVISKPNQITLWAALFHDIGKCPLETPYGKFAGHEIYSEQITISRLTKFRCLNHLIDKIARLVRNHMVDIHTNFSDMALRLFVLRIGGINNLTNWKTLRYADSLSYGYHKLTLDAIDSFVDKIYNVMHKNRLDKISFDRLNISMDEIAEATGYNRLIELDLIRSKLVDTVNNNIINNKTDELKIAAKIFASENGAISGQN